MDLANRLLSFYESVSSFIDSGIAACSSSGTPVGVFRIRGMVSCRTPNTIQPSRGLDRVLVSLHVPVLDGYP